MTCARTWIGFQKPPTGTQPFAFETFGILIGTVQEQIQRSRQPWPYPQGESDAEGEGLFLFELTTAQGHEVNAKKVLDPYLPKGEIDEFGFKEGGSLYAYGLSMFPPARSLMD
jgi:hypothetical protein